MSLVHGPAQELHQLSDLGGAPPIVGSGNYIVPNDTLMSYRTGRPWVPWGWDNLLPLHVSRLNNSPTHGAILEAKTRQTAAYGFTSEVNKWLATVVPDGNVIAFITRLAADIVQYGGFAFQVIRPAGGTGVAHLEAVRYRDVRSAWAVNGNMVDTYYHHLDWRLATSATNTPTAIPAWQPVPAADQSPYTARPVADEGTPSQPDISLYVHYDYNDKLDYYGWPAWMVAINSIALEDELSRHYLGTVRNGMVPSVIMALDAPVDDDEETDLYDSINDFYTGGHNSGKPLIVFKNGERVPQITPFPATNPNLYNELDVQAQQKILTAHGVVSPILVGLPGTGGLGGNASEIKAAHELWTNSVIRYLQAPINRAIYAMSQAAGQPFTEEECTLGTLSPVSFSLDDTVMTQIMTVNELRESAGLDPIDGYDDTFLTPITPASNATPPDTGSTAAPAADAADVQNIRSGYRHPSRVGASGTRRNSGTTDNDRERPRVSLIQRLADRLGGRKPY